MPEFDGYLMVDWSASSRPAKGPDSVWYCLLTRNHGRLTVAALENPATRNRAVAEVREILRDLVRRGESVLVGFDFPYGYPSGFSAALRLEDTPPWAAVWREIASKVVDRDDNSNNRFAVGADFNRRISEAGYPFWGYPTNGECLTLRTTKGGPGQFPEKRITDIGNMQPIWKLYGNGSVGSQALVGIPHLAVLRNDPVLAAVSRVWPFEIGLRTLADRRNRDWLVLHAEIYPSLLPIQPAPGEVKDMVQVRVLAAHFAALDDTNHLSALFAGSDSLSPKERERVECEEGWTLGVGAGSGSSERTQKPRSDLPPVRRPAIAALSAAPPRRAGAGRTTEAGYENRNGQITVRSTGLAGTDHGQYVYVLRCGSCGHEFGANGSEIHIRGCPQCQSGRPGLHY
jgi:precorrin-8X/cobalt-precorrin-8 methylmutase